PRRCSGAALPCRCSSAAPRPRKQHTAIKIAPHYTGPTVHVLDASRAVGVVASLVDAEKRHDFELQNRALQTELREVYGRRQAKPLLPYREARERRLRLDWQNDPPARPAVLGRQIEREVPLAELVPFIDWTFFFSAWELKGRYPQIFDDPTIGHAARELYDAGRHLLDTIIAEGSIRAHAVWGFWPANTLENDVIAVFADETRREEIARFPMLRQQEAKEDADKPHRSLADFVAPLDSDAPDYLGAFAATAGHGVDELVARYEAANDDYSAILVKALADRLAEALAEMLHEKARRAWGFGLAENLSKEELIDRKVPRHPPGLRLPRLPRSHAQGHALAAARRRARRRNAADRELRHASRGVGQRHLSRSPRGALFRGRPGRPRSGGVLRPAQGRRGRGGRALALAQPRVRDGEVGRAGRPTARGSSRSRRWDRRRSRKRRSDGSFRALAGLCLRRGGA
ncbi:MAG: hypothetical protein HC897_18735, partial [Thermoanaerobaculia bacterium]|nr:hypothetical protein [Thermoanaerobaculia bacterium]